MDRELSKIENKVERLIEQSQSKVTQNFYDGDDDLKVYPIGGYGSKVDKIKKFEKRYRLRKIEYLILTNLDNEYGVILEGDNERVITPDDVLEKFMTFDNRIKCHNHPPDYEDETSLSGTEYNRIISFSARDVFNHIQDRILESRVIDSTYTYVIQQPKIGWDDWYATYIDPIYEDIGGLREELERQREKEINRVTMLLESKFETFQSDETTSFQNDWVFGQATHSAILKISKKYRLPYARYSWSGYKKYDYK